MSTDVSEFEQKLNLRPLGLADYDAVVALQLRCFPGMDPWTKHEWRNLVTRFPEGQLGIFADDEGLIASCSALVVDSGDVQDWYDWMSVSDGGNIRNHDPKGDTLYGMEMQVDPEWRGYRLSRRLYDARKELCRNLNLARIVIGGRIPGYKAHADELSARDYIDAVMERRLYDPVLTSQLANGFVLKRLIADYLPSDEDSAGYATELEWTNLDHRRVRSRQLRSVHPVRVAAVQYQMRRIRSFDDFAKQVEFFVDTAGDYQSDFLLFPELFTLQLLSLVEGRPGEAARALTAFTPQYLELFSDMAVKYHVNIIGGTQFEVIDDTLYNTAFLFRRDGTIDSQKKLHVTPSESRWWGVTGGDELHVLDTDQGPIAINVCYDVEFPELARVQADQGARLLFVPYNTNDRYGHMRVRLCTQARCIENHLYAVTAGCVGNLPFVENADVHYAQSAVYTPSDIPFARDGIGAEVSPDVETVLVHDVDLEVLRRHRATGTTQNWNDRRTDLYGVSWKGGEPL
jgi:predicted amidohydrolase/ribosomal protein S18 acetylase RimI-like enzyme